MANRLRELRESRHRTQEEVAKDLNISQQSLSRYEKNGSTMNIEMAARFADYYKVSIDYLVGRTEQKRFSGEDAYLQLDEDKYALLECYDMLGAEWKEIVWAIVGRVNKDTRAAVREDAG